MLVLMGIQFVRVKRERAMSGRERVCLAYTRLQQCLKRKDKGHAGLCTLAQQIDCMRSSYGLEISEEQEKLLYEAFFAPELDCDCEMLCQELVKFRRTLRVARRIKEN